MEGRKKGAVTFVVVYSLIFWTKLGDWLVPPTWKFPFIFSVYILLFLVGVSMYRDVFVEKGKWLVRHPLKSLGILIGSWLLFLCVGILFSLLEEWLLQVFGLAGKELINHNDILAAMKQYPLILTLAVMGVLGPVVGEMIYRQFLVSALSQRSSDIVAVLISSLAFALLHVHQFQLSELIGVLGIFGYGVVFAVVFLKTDKNIYFSSALHILNNLLALIIILIN